MFSSKTCFVSSVNRIVDVFQARNQQNTNVNFKDKDDSSKWLIDMKQNIEHQSKIHQIKLINSNRKLVFYSTFKHDTKYSSFLELITNEDHRKATAKFRMGNHNLKIETRRHSYPKIPENLRTCDHCETGNIENETHSDVNYITKLEIHYTITSRVDTKISRKWTQWTRCYSYSITLILLFVRTWHILFMKVLE